MRFGIVAGLFVGLALSSPALAGEEVSVFVNERPVYSEVPPTVVSGRTLVPLRAVGEALEADVFWQAPTRTVIILSGDRRIELRPGQPSAVVDGAPVPLDVPARIVNGRTLVPLRFVAEALGVEVGWDGAARRVDITDRRPRLPYDPAALDRFLAARDELDGMTGYRADLSLVYDIADADARRSSLDMTGTVDVVDQETYAMTVVFTARVLGAKIEIPIGLRHVGGEEFVRVGSERWSRSTGPAPLQSPQLGGGVPQEVVRGLARRASATPLAGGGTDLTVVFHPAAGPILNGYLGSNPSGIQFGRFEVTIRLDGFGRVAAVSSRWRAMDGKGSLADVRMELNNIQRGAAQPVTPPPPEEIAPEAPADLPALPL